MYLYLNLLLTVNSDGFPNHDSTTLRNFECFFSPVGEVRNENIEYYLDCLRAITRKQGKTFENFQQVGKYSKHLEQEKPWGGCLSNEVGLLAIHR
jgi:hypothetical protein